VASPLGNIDKVVVIDQGNGVADGGAIGKIAKAGPSVVFNLLQQLEALGLNIPSMMQQLGATAPESSAQPPVVTATPVPPVKKN
jgi:hypothetical protein